MTDTLFRDKGTPGWAVAPADDKNDEQGAEQGAILEDITKGSTHDEPDARPTSSQEGSVAPS
jgi:hypothetical protein